MAMDGNVMRVPPVLGSLGGVEKPGWQGSKKDQPPFHLEEEAKEKEEKKGSPEESGSGGSGAAPEGDLPVAPPSEGEAGSRIDVVG